MANLLGQQQFIQWEDGWKKELFIETSILNVYTPHTCRSAGTSKVSQLNEFSAHLVCLTCAGIHNFNHP